MLLPWQKLGTARHDTMPFLDFTLSLNIFTVCGVQWGRRLYRADSTRRPACLEQSDQAGCDFVRDGRSLPGQPVPLAMVWNWSVTKCKQNTVMSYSTSRKEGTAWYSSRPRCLLSGSILITISLAVYCCIRKTKDPPHTLQCTVCGVQCNCFLTLYTTLYTVYNV